MPGVRDERGAARWYTAIVELRLPGGATVSSEEKGEDAYGAFRDALAAATEQLEQLPPRKQDRVGQASA